MLNKILEEMPTAKELLTLTAIIVGLGLLSNTDACKRIENQQWQAEHPSYDLSHLK